MMGQTPLCTVCLQSIVVFCLAYDVSRLLTLLADHYLHVSTECLCHYYHYCYYYHCVTVSLYCI